MIKEVVSEGGSLFLLTSRFTHEVLGLRPYLIMESVQFIEMEGVQVTKESIYDLKKTGRISFDTFLG